MGDKWVSVKNKKREAKKETIDINKMIDTLTSTLEKKKENEYISENIYNVLNDEKQKSV